MRRQWTGGTGRTGLERCASGCDRADARRPRAERTSPSISWRASLFQTGEAVNDAPFGRAAEGGDRRPSLTASPVWNFRNQEIDGEVRSARSGAYSHCAI